MIADSFDTIQAHAPPEYLPAIDRVQPVRTRLTARLRGYGCGGYGCVIATATPDVVLKVTTDDTEVEFARDIEPDLVVPISVHYYLAIRTRHVFRDRTVALLWREAASDVDRLKQLDGRAWRMVNDQHGVAQEVYLGFYQGKTPQDLERLLQEWHHRVEDMRVAPALAWLAEGLLRNYDERGVFFGDVHAGNLGRAERDGEPRWVITDPGHVVVVGRAPAAAPTSPCPACGADAADQEHLGEGAMVCRACDVDYMQGDDGTRNPARGCTCAHVNPPRCRHDHADPNNWSRFEIVGLEHEPGGPYIETRACRCGATVSRDLEQDVGETMWGAVSVPLEERWGDRKVFISDAWRHARIEWLAADPELTRDEAIATAEIEDRGAGGRLRSLSMEDWKDQLLKWLREGKVLMTRADLVAAMDPAKVAASEIDARGATFHFIAVPPAAR